MVTNRYIYYVDVEVGKIRKLKHTTVLKSKQFCITCKIFLFKPYSYAMSLKTKLYVFRSLYTQAYLQLSLHKCVL